MHFCAILCHTMWLILTVSGHQGISSAADSKWWGKLLTVKRSYTDVSVCCVVCEQCVLSAYCRGISVTQSLASVFVHRLLRELLVNDARPTPGVTTHSEAARSVVFWYLMHPVTFSVIFTLLKFFCLCKSFFFLMSVIGWGFFWYRLTWVVPDKGLLNGCVCVCVIFSMLWN